jgi:hypothetical protein
MLKILKLPGRGRAAGNSHPQSPEAIEGRHASGSTAEPREDIACGSRRPGRAPHVDGDGHCHVLPFRAPSRVTRRRRTHRDVR